MSLQSDLRMLGRRLRARTAVVMDLVQPPPEYVPTWVIRLVPGVRVYHVPVQLRPSWRRYLVDH